MSEIEYYVLICIDKVVSIFWFFFGSVNVDWEQQNVRQRIRSKCGNSTPAIGEKSLK